MESSGLVEWPQVRRKEEAKYIGLWAHNETHYREGGKVTVSLLEKAQSVTITIADTGIGIPKRDMHKLGRPFEQVENQFTKTKSGSGLGLAISKSLIELHDGQVLIDSTEGKGTTVSVKLPKRAKVEAAA